MIDPDKIAELLGGSDSLMGGRILLRNKVLVRDRKGWTRQEWVDDAREVMEHQHGSVEALLDGHVRALFSFAEEVEEQVALAYREGFHEGRRDMRDAAVRAIDELMDGPRE